MEEYLQRTKSRLNRGKQLEKVHTVIGNKCCDLDSIISTLAYAYYLDKISSSGVLCLPVLNVPRVEFTFHSETRFILEELDIPESCLVFKDEINLHHLNDDGRLSITLINFTSLTSDEAALESSVVKVINPDKRCYGGQEFHESSSSLVAKEILEEAPEIVTRHLAHLLRGSILFCCLSAEHDRIPAQQEDILYMLEEKYPELPPRQDLISSLQETKLHTQGASFEEILLKDFKELSDGDIKVAISTVSMSLEELMSYRNIIGDLKTFLDKYGLDVLLLLASYTLEDQTTIQQVAVYSENPELCNQVCCELEECQNPFLDLEPSDYGCEQFLVYQQENSLINCDQISTIIKEAVNRRRIGMVPNSRTSSTEAVAGSAPLSQGSSGIMELYGSDLDPQPNPGNFADQPQDNNESAQAQVDVNVDLVSPDSGLATIRSSRSSKESSVFLSDDSPVAEVAGPHHSFLPGNDSYSPIPEGVIIEEETPSRNHSDNLDLFSFDLVPNIRSESSSHSADYSMADDFFFQSDLSEGPQPIPPKEHVEHQHFRDDMTNSNDLMSSNISLVEFDDDFMQTPKNHEAYSEKKPSLSDMVDYDSFLSSEIPGNIDIKIPPTPMNSLVESSPLDNGPPSFFPEDVIEKINEIGVTDASQSQAKYSCWWDGGELHPKHENLLNVDTWSSGEQESVFHSPDSWKDQKQNKSLSDHTETKQSNSSFKVAFLDQRANAWETHDKNVKKENEAFSDLWQSNKPLPVMSDLWCGSSEKNGHDEKQTIDAWCTFDNISNTKDFVNSHNQGEIDTDHSSENTPDKEMENTVCEDLFQGNQDILNHSGAKNLETKPKLIGIKSETEVIDDLKHIERNLCVWNLYEENEGTSVDEPHATWNDPFLSYRCLDFTKPNLGKDGIVSPPDTNYSTSDSNISPTSEDDMKKLEKSLDSQLQLEQTDQNLSSGYVDMWNHEDQKFCTFSRPENNNYSKNESTVLKDNIRQSVSEDSRCGISDRESDCKKSEKINTNSLKQSSILSLEEFELTNHKPELCHEYIPKDTERESPEINCSDLYNRVNDFTERVQKAEKEASPKLPLTLNQSNLASMLHQEDRSDIDEYTTTSSSSSHLINTISWKSKEESKNSGFISPNILRNSFAGTCTESLSDDKAIDVQGPKIIDNFAESQSITPIEEEGEHIIKANCNNQGTLETDFEEDTESSSLNTPDDLQSSDMCFSENWDQLHKSPVFESSVNQDGHDMPSSSDTNSVKDEVSKSKTNNKEASNFTRRLNSPSQEANNVYQAFTSEKSFEGENQSLTRKIQIKENVLFSDTTSEKPPDYRCDEDQDKDKTSEETWNNGIYSNSESAETDSDLSSGVSNEYLKDKLNIKPYNNEDILSSSSHSSITSPDLDESWGAIQEISHDTSLGFNLPVPKNNEQNNCVQPDEKENSRNK
ncbi:protein prune homolog 2-like [Discoglossus pictus]